MIYEFLSYIQDKIVWTLVDNGNQVGNYFLLNITYLLLDYFNLTFTVNEIENTWRIPHSTVADILAWWEKMLFLIIIYYYNLFYESYLIFRLHMQQH
jgi:hypothetical protein